MKTVWVVEQGSYSDYHVVGVFTTKEKAELVATAVMVGAGEYAQEHDKATVAEWPLDPIVEQLNAGRWKWELRMRRDGTVDEVERVEELQDSQLPIEEESFKLRTKKDLDYPPGSFTHEWMRATVWATDEKHAIKIVNERRTQMIAEGQWPE